MDRLTQIEAFVSVATRGSLSAAARVEGVTPAIIGRRIDALEARLGARLLVRTTRKLTLTIEGQAFLEDQPLSQAALAERLQRIGAARPDTEVQLRADAAVPYGRVVEVMGAAHSAGLQRIGFVAEQPAAAR